MTNQMSIDAIGYLGGALLSICLLPELIIMWKNKSAEDVSLIWNTIYFLGLSASFAYLYLDGAIAGWISIIPEILFSLFMFFSKIFLDKKADITGTSKRSILKELHESKRMIQSLTYNSDFSDSFTYDGAKGYHVFFDYCGIISDDSKELSDWTLKTIEEILIKYKINVVHKHAVVFDGSTSPPGFTSVFLIDESHVSAHSYSRLGLLALDVFTCGGRPDITRKVANEIHDGVMLRFPNCQNRVRENQRFPSSLEAYDQEENYNIEIEF